MSIRDEVLKAFRAAYMDDPRFLVRAPGRANLIGEHTDYNDGFVMPLAVDRAVWLAVTSRGEHRINVQSLDFGNQKVSFLTDQLDDPTLPEWTKPIRGGWWLLQQAGHTVPGANIVIGSDVPMGAGMSSSAAIGVGIIQTVLMLLGDVNQEALLELLSDNEYRKALDDLVNVDQVAKALLAVEIEHQFMQVPCGVMDQMASAAALDGTVMLLDCRSLKSEAVPVSDNARIVVINSMKSRELAEGSYAERRAQCVAAAKILDVPALRDATLEMLEAKREALGDVNYRRAKHVITENIRTLEMKSALAQNNLLHAGELLNNSHLSLRDDYEVSVAELDILTDIARQHSACYGARIMGGGFGGCAVALVKTDQVDDFLRSVEPMYEDSTGLKPESYVCIPSQGSSVEIIKR